MKNKIIGYGNQIGLVTGKIITWDENYLIPQNSSALKSKIIYVKRDIPLFIVAYFEKNNVAGVLFAKGEKNYHPIIFLKDANIPAICGLGDTSFDSDCQYFINSLTGEVSKNNKVVPKESNIVDTTLNSNKYANVGNRESIHMAHKLGAKGIGILRTEFIAVRALSEILENRIEGMKILDYMYENGEANTFYKALQIPTLRLKIKKYFTDIIGEGLKYFQDKEFYIRTLDLPINESDTLGFRGIRRCLNEPQNGSLSLLAEVITFLLSKIPMNTCKIGILIPLVSNYYEISLSANYFLSKGFTFSENRANSLLFGWKVENPSSIINSKTWITAFKKEFGKYPYTIGVGSNDLTQFSLSYSRDLSINNPVKVYDELDFSILYLLFHLSENCKKTNIKLFIHGELASDKMFAVILKAMNYNLSVSVNKLSDESYITDIRDFSNWYMEYLLTKYPLKIQKPLIKIINKQILSIVNRIAK